MVLKVSQTRETNTKLLIYFNCYFLLLKTFTYVFSKHELRQTSGQSSRHVGSKYTEFATRLRCLEKSLHTYITHMTFLCIITAFKVLSDTY
jgi:hypothetical protein